MSDIDAQRQVLGDRIEVVRGKMRFRPRRDDFDDDYLPDDSQFYAARAELTLLEKALSALKRGQPVNVQAVMFEAAATYDQRSETLHARKGDRSLGAYLLILLAVVLTIIAILKIVLTAHHFGFQ